MRDPWCPSGSSLLTRAPSLYLVVAKFLSLHHPKVTVLATVAVGADLSRPLARLPTCLPRITIKFTRIPKFAPDTTAIRCPSTLVPPRCTILAAATVSLRNVIPTSGNIIDEFAAAAPTKFSVLSPSIFSTRAHPTSRRPPVPRPPSSSSPSPPPSLRPSLPPAPAAPPPPSTPLAPPMPHPQCSSSNEVAVRRMGSKRQISF